MVTPVWQIQRELEYAQAREAYYRTRTPNTTTTVIQRPSQKVVYRPLLLRFGTDVPAFALNSSEKSITYFGLAALGLVDDATALADAETAPRGFKPSMVRAMTGDGTPTARRAYNGTGRRYIKYSSTTEGETQAHYNAPISAGGDTPTIQELETKFGAIVTAKRAALGDYGRIYLEVEAYSKSGV